MCQTEKEINKKTDTVKQTLATIDKKRDRVSSTQATIDKKEIGSADSSND